MSNNTPSSKAKRLPKSRERFLPLLAPSLSMILYADMVQTEKEIKSLKAAPDKWKFCEGRPETKQEPCGFWHYRDEDSKQGYCGLTSISCISSHVKPRYMSKAIVDVAKQQIMGQINKECIVERINMKEIALKSE